MKRLILAVALGLAACGTGPRPEPKIVTVEVKIPVAVECPDKRAPHAPLPDTPQAIAAAGDIFDLAKIYKAANILLHQMLDEANGQIAVCAKAPPKPPDPSRSVLAEGG